MGPCLGSNTVERRAVVKRQFTFLFAAICVSAFLAFTDRDTASLVVLAVGFLSLGRKLLLPFAHLVCLLFSTAFCTLAWYTPFWYFGDVPFRDFLEEWWFGYLYIVAAALVGYWSIWRASEETWAILRKNHSTPSELTEQPPASEVERGFLTYEAELLPVDSWAVSTGIVLARPGGDAMHIPWEIIRDLTCVKKDGSEQAMLEMNRTFTVGVPWRSSFDKMVPDRLKEPV